MDHGPDLLISRFVYFSVMCLVSVCTDVCDPPPTPPPLSHGSLSFLGLVFVVGVSSSAPAQVYSVQVQKRGETIKVPTVRTATVPTGGGYHLRLVAPFRGIGLGCLFS